jgi:hypothetical protein
MISVGMMGGLSMKNVEWRMMNDEWEMADEG